MIWHAPAGSHNDIFLHPGDWFFGRGEQRVRTILGSCVSIVLWHPECRLGGMCHYMLPGRRANSDDPLNGRYADDAMALLLAEVKRHNTRVEDYEFKLFGGGNMFSRATSSPADVAIRNVVAARELMQQLGVRVKAQSLGGFGHRQLILDLSTGELRMRHSGGARPNPLPPQPVGLAIR